MEANEHRPAWKTLLAFAIIYFVWGTTYLAIRVGVHEIPPFLLAAIRFLIAGGILPVGGVVARGERSPTARQWMAVSAIAIFIFVLDYGVLFWAEQKVPSDITARSRWPRSRHSTWLSKCYTFLRDFRPVAMALLIGIGGVAVLMSRSLKLAGAPIDMMGAVALIIASMSWSLGSVLTRKLTLPASKVMSSGAQMLAGECL